MANEFDNAFDSNDGFTINGGTFITGGTVSPVGISAPVSTLYIQEEPQGVTLWKHFSTNPNDWKKISSEIFEASPPTVTIVHNGTLSGNQLVGSSNLVNIPIAVGFRSRLSRVSSNNSRNGADFSLDFFRNKTDQGNNNGFYRYDVNNNNPKFDVVSGGPTFEAGDLLYIYYRDTGLNARDLALNLYFEAVPA